MISVYPLEHKASLDGQAILLPNGSVDDDAIGRPTPRHAIIVTTVLWTLVTALLLAADWLAVGDVRPAVWASIVAGYPITLAASLLTFRMVMTLHARRKLRLAVFLAIVTGAGMVEAGKDKLALEFFDLSSPSFVSLAFRAFSLELMLLGILAAIFMTWVQARQQIEQQRALAKAREAEAEARLIASRAESAAVEARLSALRYQLNPHFLFNTLNAISSMVVTGRNVAAEGMLDRLCEFLRATLATKTSGLVSLEDELATMASYLEIENFRLRERLHVEFVCPPDLVTALVPGFMLQPLIENAIKHGVGRSSRQVTIKIEVERMGADRLAVRVSDDAVPDLAGTPGKGFGVGLNNVAARLEAIYGKDAALTAAAAERGYTAQLDLPLKLAGGTTS